MGGDYEPQHTYDNTAYDNSEAYDPSDDVSASDAQAEPTQSQGGHSMLGIFNEYMKDIKAQQPAPEAAAAQPT